MEYLKEHKPRVLFVSLGETDDWAHGGDYAQYLNAAHRADHYIQSSVGNRSEHAEYRGKTTLIFSTDHGRGTKGRGWTDHGEKVKGSEEHLDGLPRARHRCSRRTHNHPCGFTKPDCRDAGRSPRRKLRSGRAQSRTAHRRRTGALTRNSLSLLGPPVYAAFPSSDSGSPLTSPGISASSKTSPHCARS